MKKSLEFNKKYCTYIESKDLWKPKNMTVNLETLLDYYQIKVKFNMMSKEIEFTIPNQKDVSIHNEQEISIQGILDRAIYHNFNINANIIYPMLITIADKEKYHPVKTFIEKAYTKYKNDEETEFQKLLSLIEQDHYFPSTLKETILKTWLVSCVKAVFDGKIKSEGVLVLQGKQGIFKTTLLKTLAYNDNWVKDGHLLDPSNKDTVLESINHWIVELGELEDTLKKEMGRLKAFISKDVDEIRKPYSKASSKYPRQTIFSASVNDKEFLKDNTGNRRWWVIPVISIDRDLLMKLNIPKLWAEIYKMYANGHKHILEQATEKLLFEINSNFEVICINQSNILKTYNFESEERKWVPFSDIRADLSNFKISDTKIGTLLNKMNIESKKVDKTLFKLMPPKRQKWYKVAERL